MPWNITQENHFPKLHVKHMRYLDESKKTVFLSAPNLGGEKGGTYFVTLHNLECSKKLANLNTKKIEVIDFGPFPK